MGEGDSTARGVRVGLAAYLIWGFLTVYWKGLSAFNAFELIGWRMLCASGFMVLVITWKGSWQMLREAFADPTIRGLQVLAALLLAGNWTSYVWAVTNDRVIETALGYFIAPLATMAIGVLVLHERPTRAQQFAFACAAVAVVILTISYGRPPWIALALAGSWSFYGLTKRRVDLPAVESLGGETFVLALPALVVVATMSGRAGSVVNSASAGEWVLVLGTGVVTAIPLMLFASAAKSIPFTLLGPLNLVVPVINFGLGWLLYDEPMPLDRVVGFAFVWVALGAVMWDRIATSRRESVPEPATGV
jgi:chloramphenicol-sensitive protein RarD